MKNIKARTLSFAPSPSPDVAGYRVYWCHADEEPDFNCQSADVGMKTDGFLIPPDLPWEGLDGDYKVAISAYDSVGNEAMGEAVTVPFDFIAPDAPGAPVIGVL